MQPSVYRDLWQRLKLREREDGPPSPIDEILPEGARWMLAAAMQAEEDAHIVAHAAEWDETTVASRA